MLVTVVNSNPIWPNEFERESQKLRSILDGIINEIYHIGSTAVPGLMAKPIIDIMLDVRDLDLLDAKSKELEKLEYEVMGELGIAGRRYFRKGGNNRTHQIHAFKSGDAHLVRHLAFRDYLIEHDAIAQAYGELKFEISLRCNNDIELYCDEKDAFVKHHEMKALEWYEQRDDQ